GEGRAGLSVEPGHRRGGGKRERHQVRDGHASSSESGWRSKALVVPVTTSARSWKVRPGADLSFAGCGYRGLRRRSSGSPVLFGGGLGGGASAFGFSCLGSARGAGGSRLGSSRRGGSRFGSSRRGGSRRGSWLP